MREHAVIVAMGACTPLGRDVWASAAAVRAGISGFVQHPYMLDTAGEPMRAAIAPWLDIGLDGADRLAALLFPAIDEALAPVSSASLAPLRMAIALGLPSARPGFPESLPQQMRRRLQHHYGDALGSAACFTAGHAAGLLAMQAAVNKLEQGTLDVCLVAGVDSYIAPLALEWLEGCSQLHGAGPSNNAWGFIPGEGAAALVLMRQAKARASGLQPLAHVLGTGTAMEDKRIKTQTVCIGEGLTQAFRNALGGLPDGTQISDVYCDLNGEPYRADEFGFTAMRTQASFVAASGFVAPADCWGDVAAAGGPLHLCLATVAGCKGYSRGDMALAWASSEHGERAATLLATARRN
ncbi:beta-ketoacyl synthase N-terminal-like domain-containing protein [Pseudorhodoferax soli]|nr:beta-ketoacyl synthase N-terminal-like domain-containing protein [Pseudorhodoferax soli]